MPRGLRYPLVDVPQHVIQCERNRQAAYPWSSYRWHALGHPDLVVTDHPFYLALARTPQERQQVYQALFQERIHTGLLREIRTTLQQGRIFGTERFKDGFRPSWRGAFG